MKYTVVVNGRFNAFDYSRELQDRGQLAGLVSTMPRKVARKYGISAGLYDGLPQFELSKRVFRKMFRRELPCEAYAKAFTSTALKRVRDECDAIVAFAGYALEIFESKKCKGKLRVLHRGSTHTLENSRLRNEAFQYHGRAYTPLPDSFIARELREYEVADKILVPSTFVYESFVKNGVNASKLMLNPYGCSLHRFRDAESSVGSESSDENVILFVGQVCERKGIGVLVRAVELVSQVRPCTKLRVVGAIAKGCRKFLQSEVVDYAGVLGPKELAAEYRRASVFVLPSFEEGQANVLLESAYFGLPIVATRNSGIKDCKLPSGFARICDVGSVDSTVAEILKALEAPRVVGHVVTPTWKAFTDRLVKSCSHVENVVQDLRLGDDA
ncbi:glycosyltransferase family 4 protein [Rhodopirellula sp. JC740]|uniref:Glycosyltransferase family 4 protein n=1 Tax=Rhodopirellula halodulae TaxID=2894198 RepID=A0ABS8NGQ4_9BACT|nr:glycosyltransferase family 4 protein [Rhodopirellula sp. JC740]MCC9642722.1 glycosyltransferase family 4 protein [Rhodopirellula sp. JC740]